jgi:protein-tyrosine phosphatase
MSFAVLFVCTGNICRSPMAERLFLARLPPGVPVRTFGAGTVGLEGWAMDPASAAVLRELGGDPDGHVAHRLTPARIGAADLILTAQAEHRSAVMQEDPLAFRKAFTLREFGRLGARLGRLDGAVGVDRLRARVAEVADQRGQVEPPDVGADEITDPFGAPLPVVRACGEQIAAAVDAVLASLGLTPRAGPS